MEEFVRPFALLHFPRRSRGSCTAQHSVQPLSEQTLQKTSSCGGVLEAFVFVAIAEYWQIPSEVLRKRIYG